MTAAERQKVSVYKRAVSALKKIEKMVNSLDKARDRVSVNSPDCLMIERAMGSLRDAASDLGIVCRRNYTKLPETKKINNQPPLF